MEQEEPNTTFEDYCNQLPKESRLGLDFVEYQGFWVRTNFLKSILPFQAHFQAQPTDIFVTGMPKTGNTWLKSLVFAIVHRHQHSISDNPLLRYNSHDLIPFLEIGIYGRDPKPNLDKVLMYPNPPRILSSHLPYGSLPESIIDSDSKCKIIYICRNPLDTCVSSWLFFSSVLKKNNPNHPPPTIEEYFEFYIQGKTSFGPFFEHVLDFWKKSIEMPNKILFLKYEELLNEPTSQLKRIAEFVQKPFSQDEEQNGVIEEIVKLCSIKNLKELTVNKQGGRPFLDFQMLFRKGKVGDWTNYLTPVMADRMRDLMHEKFDDYGLWISDTLF